MNNQLFDSASWKHFVSGYFVKDCTIGFEESRLGFLLYPEIQTAEEMEDGWDIRLLAIRTDLPMDRRFFCLEGRGLNFATLSSAWPPNQGEFLAVDTERRIWSYKPKFYKGKEPEIPFDGRGYGYADLEEVGCAIIKVVRVGTTVFAVGFPFRIFERLSDQQWREVKDIPIPDALKSMDDDVIKATIGKSGFHDLAGYTTDDMYAVGEAGTVWHKKGETWRQCAFPSDLDLHTVACGGDGLVYITDIRGSVWKGREDRWELVAKASISEPFVDSAWFDNRLWCTNKYGIRVLEDQALVAADCAKAHPMPSSSLTHARSIDVSPDGKTMLVAGGLGASIFDGERWEVLLDGSDLE